MSEKGWIKLHRGIQDNWIWDNKPYAMGQAFIDLILLANHKDHKRLHGGSLVEFKEGTVCMSILQLSNRWGWSRKKTTSFLRLLEDDGMVTTNSTRQGTTITIENWGNFQHSGTTERTTEEQQKNNEGTTKEQRVHTNKNERMKRMKEEDIYTPAKPTKKTYGEFSHVRLTDDEYSKLVSEYGEVRTRNGIKRVDEYIEQTGKKYKNHYLVLKKWGIEEVAQVKSTRFTPDTDRKYGSEVFKALGSL